ncbi:MAG TPA: hypothetical protein PK467_14405 [Candidatus Wallbacteria bacterium]|nr:hypothetical protein [Candidatus Wallbacteria bacterium]
MIVDCGGVLEFDHSAVEFAPGKGVLSSGVIKAANSTFRCSDEKAYWSAIALIGEGASDSFFEKCFFVSGGGFSKGRLECAYGGAAYDEQKDEAPKNASLLFQAHPETVPVARRKELQRQAARD